MSESALPTLLAPLLCVRAKMLLTALLLADDADELPRAGRTGKRKSFKLLVADGEVDGLLAMADGCVCPCCMHEQAEEQDAQRCSAPLASCSDALHDSSVSRLLTSRNKPAA